MRAARADGIAPHPWGEARPGGPGPLRGNFGEKPGAGLLEYELVAETDDRRSDGYPGLAPGCTFPAGNSPFGVCDLAGNIGEWVEPAGDDTTAVFKGGTWMDAEDGAFHVAARGRLALDRNVTSVGYYLTGFRCARDASR